MKNIDPELYKRLEDLKFHEKMHDQLGLNSLITEKNSTAEVKSNTWVKIKIVLITGLIIIGILIGIAASILLLPIAIFVVVALVLFIVGKLLLSR